MEREAGRAISGRVAVFCFSSAGELDVVLPLLKIWNIADFALIAFKQEILRKIKGDTFYCAVVGNSLEDRVILKLSPNKLRRWMQLIANSTIVFWRFRKFDQFLFEYGNSGREKNVLIALLVLTGRAGKILFYPHGHAVTSDGAYSRDRWPAITRYSAKYGARILKINGAAPDRHFVGIEYPILHPQWKHFVQLNVPQLYRDHVVILSRDVHPHWLLEVNRTKMLDDTVEVLSRYFPHSRIVLKAHPRELIATKSIAVNGKIVEVTYENTYSVVRGANLAVSFWTSAFFQCQALGVPVIEYHIPHERFQTHYPNGSLNAAFVPSCRSKAELIRHVAAFGERAARPGS